MNIKTLNFYPRPNDFDDTLEKFFDTYNTTEDIECYQIEVPDGEGGESMSYLTQNFPKYTFQTKVVILNIQNMILDRFSNIDLDGLVEFCVYHHDQQFIIFNDNINLQNIKIKNLYTDTIISTSQFRDQDQIKYSDDPCDCIQLPVKKTNITNQWLFLNSNARLHKIITLCYLLSKDYYRNGLINIGNILDSHLLFKDYYIPQYSFGDTQLFNQNLNYEHNISKMSTEFKSEFKKGYARFKSKDFNKLKIDVHTMNSVYETTGVEIITGSRFFEQNPLINGKSNRSFYAQNFPIYINGVGMAKWMKELFGLDIFEDIIDHSYDEITDHFERLAAAIDRNAHILDGSTNIHELWHDNRKRFEDNCEKLDNIFREGTYRTNFNNEKIKKALLHFGIDSVNK